MKGLIEKEFVDMGKLNPSERREVDAADNERKQAIGRKYGNIRMDILDRENALYGKLAVQTGFSGYAEGENAYQAVEKKQQQGQPLSDDEVNNLKAFFNAKTTSPEYAEICQAYRDTYKNEMDERAWAEQLYLNDVLTRTRWKYDTRLRVDGEQIAPPVTWRVWSTDYQEQMEVPRERTMTVPDGTGQEIQVDRGVAQWLGRLWQAGIATGASCSGLLKDHPYHRYVSDDELGRWKAGQYRFQNRERCHAYMSFPLENNDPLVMSRIAEKAESWGWTVENRSVYGKESLAFYPAHTLDGTSYSAIFEENRQRLATWQGRLDELTLKENLIEVEKMHGGIIPYTDAMVEHLWNKLALGILETQRQVKDERLQANIEAGRAVKVYEYDSDTVQLSEGALAEVFARSGLELDRSSIDRPMDRSCVFTVTSDGKATLLPAGAGLPEPEMTAGRHTLSYLMASQLKDAVHGSQTEDRITVMVHPEPQTAEDWNRFTFTEPVMQHEYYAYMVNEGDLTQLVANRFAPHLYEAAAHAYGHSFQKTLDDAKGKQLFSDIEIRTRPGGDTYIRCKIQGQWQLGRQMSPEDVAYYRYRMAASDKAYNGVAPELARKYYREEISNVLNGQDRRGGRTR